MYDFGLTLAALFGGVFGAAIGFFLFIVTALLIALPFILINRRSQEPHDNEAISDSRF